MPDEARIILAKRKSFYSQQYKNLNTEKYTECYVDLAKAECVVCCVFEFLVRTQCVVL